MDKKRCYIQALAPELRSYPSRLPCAVLAELVADDRTNLPSVPFIARAALLAAVQHSFAERLIAEIPAARRPANTRCHLQTARNPLQIAAGRLKLKPCGQQEVAIPGRVGELLGGLAVPFCRELIKWSPPVISNPAPGAYVFGGGIVAFIASRRIPTDKVYARVLVASPAPTYSIVDLACLAVDFYGRLVDQNRDLIIRAAPSLELAGLLTGLSRARCGQIRERDGTVAV